MAVGNAPGEGDVGYNLEAMRTLSVGWHSGYERTVAHTGRKCKPKRALGASGEGRSRAECDIMCVLPTSSSARIRGFGE